MVIPMNFVIGAAVGAITTYVIKKERVKDAGSKLKSGVDSFMASFKKQPEEDSESGVENGEVIDSIAEEVTDKASAART